MGDVLSGFAPTVNPFGGPQPPTPAEALGNTADLVKDQYQSAQEDRADAIADRNAKNADQDLKRYNDNSGRITEQNMGPDCKTCPTNFKSMTIDGLKTVRKNDSHGTEYKGEAVVVAGITQSVKQTSKGDLKSGTYYYLDKKNNWIKVTAKKAFQGKSEEVELSGGGKIDGGPVSVDATAHGGGEAEVAAPHAGLNF